MKLKDILEVEPSPVHVALDLGCGTKIKSGFTGVDLVAPGVDKRVDLFKFPLPWEDSSVDEIWCSHLIEYIPKREVGPRDTSGPTGEQYLGEDFFFAFMSECWRILKAGSIMTVVVANARCTLAFSDPLVRRQYVAETFFYLSAEWRVANDCSFYPVRCDFSPSITPIVHRSLTLRHEQYQAQVADSHWNAILNWQVTLMAKKETHALP
jgi:hypothetical protein